MRLNKKTAKTAAAFAVLFISIALTAIGLYRQEQLDIFEKAVRICLECIGIG